MEGQPSTGNSQHQYQSAQWSRLVRRNTLADAPSNPSPNTAPLQLPTQLDLLPILLPHQAFHQNQLAHYNKLIASGRTSRIQTSPLPPLLSTEHIQAVPGSRSGSSSGNTTRSNKSSARGGHGNKEARKYSKGERALITEKESPPTMPGKKLDLSGQLPLRPLAQHQNTTISQQSSSVPSTPHQHARKFSFESREPSPTAANNHSPRSAYSESNITLPSSRPQIPPLRGGCHFETAMAHTRRRMPYSLGSERLERLNLADVKSRLSEDEERDLTTDMRELYDRLLPTPQGEKNRRRLVEKLEQLFNSEWPGHDIRVHVFGSSGNLLCTDESDVDICITTDWKELEGVCMIADLLAKSGMTNVICVSTAKVPIVKIFDPELGLACDMNVNNTLALENTRMIKTYIEIDPRVRPLAMIIKHWTKRRIVNDAAFGGTLSSYTWICMIINFLQTRKPPVLPALHQRPHMKLPPKDGVESAFADDLNALRNFGQKNEEPLGGLLFSFFRFYSHEFDYDKLVISVRSGRQISKVEKRWHITNNNALCVEEPFNIGRNLGNTADDTSFRGLHTELRRAFDLISVGKLEECCEQYEFPKEEKPNRERPAAVKSKPAIIRSASQSNSNSSSRGRGGGHRGNRSQRNNNHSNRRASSGAFDPNQGYIPSLPHNIGAQEHWLQVQAQAQLHNDLYQTYSVLQAQENNLRQQLLHQSQIYMQGHGQNLAYAQSQSRSRGNSIATQQANDRNRTNSFDQPPLTAPIRPEYYFYPLNPMQYNPGSMAYPWQSSSTNPPSPSMTSATPELRRSIHRSSVTNGSGVQSNSSLRSHSQPAARSVPSQLLVPGAGTVSSGLGIYSQHVQPNGVPNFIAADENSESGFDTPAESISVVAPEEKTEYLGYYVGPPPMRSEPVVPKIPTFGDLQAQHGRRRLSTDHMPQSFFDRLNRPSRSPSPLGHERSLSYGAYSAPITAVPSQHGVSTNSLRTFSNQGPLVVNGSSSTGISIPNWRRSVDESSASEEHSSDAAFGSMESSSHLSLAESDLSHDQELAGQITPTDARTEGRVEPMVVNGSTSLVDDSAPIYTSPPVTKGVSPPQLSTPNGFGHDTNGALRLSPNTRNRLARQAQNGGMSPLDIGSGQGDGRDILREDAPLLSPVYEIRTPSPTANRKFEPTIDRKLKRSNSKDKEGRLESSFPLSKLGPVSTNQPKQPSEELKVNGHTRAVKSEGSPGSWQKISKGRKKGASEKSSPNGQPQIEKQPIRDSERKGG
ncbi:Poly(A) RNA polymerase cid13 [Hyphodiscus hymeniophilus]|uniref:polynucleotide adenylyltransferase n=1 Tax=Hyphodiscus hymeniophilus TaxID=353542 RepID=A0A9P6VLY8_9HELO|nr:Poly(A) RNA polymerase cid13 [Hyphodiscus hymeniophilus]